jgi:hypothetical protein
MMMIMMTAKLLQLPVAAAAMISDVGRKRCWGMRKSHSLHATAIISRKLK